MPKVTYIESDQTEHVVEVNSGTSVMLAAVENGIPGIDADCGGGCACATPHVYVAEAWLAQTGKRDAMETSMLNLAEGVAENSRLSCQITVNESLDGLIVRMPESQH